ncbi:MAG: phosphoribosylaminoimidazolesuccinocarboxamide synthase [Sphaerochaetaceae bacterium]|nr:phosphoribosylaminoimidazolesuccinocarboxamide synthase [Sphaerochaetaceae bacterium]MDC7237198.1 phosphoribosylaminoimidazolesuccinocarboxamide synthase [Sphaerochaetaceae bacterium]MDC7243888.1 phosphoribosylaminoimidazolesuccinocarboxamide synthase [Sphaerochaetaceae bacterium]
MKKLNLLYQGKAKKVYQSDDENLCIVDYSDAATAFNGVKKGTINNKGAINNQLSNYFMRELEKDGIPTHFVEELSDRETLVKKLKIIPLEVIVRNIVAGSLSKRIGIEEGFELKNPIIEFCYKEDSLNDPMLNISHITTLEIATKEELDLISEYSLKINEFLQKELSEKGILLVDFKLEFGKDSSNKIYLADEISPDTCRFWDAKTHKKLDKDRFRRDLGEVEDAYIEVKSRIMN